VNVPGVSSSGAAASVASDMRCHAEGLHLETDHLLGPLRQNLDCRRFYSNEKVEMAMFEWLRLEKPTFQRDGIFERVIIWEKHHCHKGLCWKFLYYSEIKEAKFSNVMISNFIS